MLDVLAWIWDTITGPILDHLGHTHPVEEGRRWPRIWWSPTGPLTVLPLHAAGHHVDDGRAVLDRVVSSYTPTVRMLTRARTTKHDGKSHWLSGSTTPPATRSGSLSRKLMPSPPCSPHPPHH
jgi:hypothetical protein